MPPPHLRPATPSDLPRIWEIRHGTTENPLTDATLVTNEEVAWYLEHAIFLVSEDETGVQGFTCVNHQTAYVWALFVADSGQRQGHGTALLNAAMQHLRQAGHRQAFLSTDTGTAADAFYLSHGWEPMGKNMNGEMVFRFWL